MELLIRRHDKTNPDPEKDFFCLKSGDVVAVRLDGWNWGLQELSNPDWRIVRAVNLDPANADELVGADWTGKDKNNGDSPNRIRKYTLNQLSPLITPAFAAFWNDDTRTTPIYETTLPLDSIKALRKIR